MKKRKDLLIILILAVLVSAFAGYISEFPLPNTRSTPCFLEACPLRIDLVSAALFFLLVCGFNSRLVGGKMGFKEEVK
jgi:hypothetical protein